MSMLQELYQQVIVDHSKHPRNFGKLEDATHVKEGFNPLCGDKLKFYVNEKNNIIEKIKFEGSGCAISLASASLMSEALTGKNFSEVEQLFNDFHLSVTEMRLTQSSKDSLEERLGKLSVLAGVAEFPARVKCATLAWHTLKAALHNEDQPVSTE